MNGEIIRKAFEEAGITDPVIKKQIWRQATWNTPIVADNFGPETDVTDRVVKAIKDYKEKHKGEDPHGKYHLRKVTFPCCGTCKYYDTGDAPNASMMCTNNLMRDEDGIATFPNCDDVCDLYESSCSESTI